MLKGALHVHSKYSDGEFTLPELRQMFAAAGCSFVCMTDHAESFDGLKLGAYVRECEALSDANFRFVAGLEFECRQKMHVLGYGVTSRVNSSDPEEVFQHIARENGIAVIAHPGDEGFSWIESFETLPAGIEAWNSKHDGQYAPRPSTFRLIERLRKRKSELLAFYGQDLHRKNQFDRLFTEVQAPSPKNENVLAAMAAGHFAGRCGDLELPAKGSLSEPLLARFGRVQGRYDPMRRLLRRMKKVAKRVGVKVPDPVITQFRRIF